MSAPPSIITQEEAQAMNLALRWARAHEVGISFHYHETTDHWHVTTWSPAKRECLTTKESSTIAIAFDRLVRQWDELFGEVSP